MNEVATAKTNSIDASCRVDFDDTLLSGKLIDCNGKTLVEATYIPTSRYDPLKGAVRLSTKDDQGNNMHVEALDSTNFRYAKRVILYLLSHYKEISIPNPTPPAYQN